MEPASLESLLTAFHLQAGLCRHFDSPFYADLMAAARDDVEAGGPVHALVADWCGDPIRGFLPLRVFGAVHDRVLSGAAPDLAAHYPTAGGRADAQAAWPGFRDRVARDGELLRPWLERFPQTNEVRRCAGLLGGFLTVAARFGRPLRLLEIGCSAGLNLAWPEYHYRLGEHTWGDPDSPVRIETDWRGEAPPRGAAPAIHSRAGCDLAPRSVMDAEAVRGLEAYVWADQPERLAQLRGAAAVARRAPPRIAKASAADWLAEVLPVAPAGVCDVVYHSSVWGYLSPDEQQRVRATIEQRGARAEELGPIAWLRHDDSADGLRIEIRVRVWPGNEEHLLGLGHPHGRVVEWSPHRVDTDSW